MNTTPHTTAENALDRVTLENAIVAAMNDYCACPGYRLDEDNVDGKLHAAFAAWIKAFGDGHEGERLIDFIHAENDRHFKADHPEKLKVLSEILAIFGRAAMDVIGRTRYADLSEQSDDLSSATPLIQNQTTQTLGSVFAEGYFPKTPPESSALFTSDGRPVDTTTRMILTEGFPTGGLDPTNQKTASIDQG